MVNGHGIHYLHVKEWCSNNLRQAITQYSEDKVDTHNFEIHHHYNQMELLFKVQHFKKVNMVVMIDHLVNYAICWITHVMYIYKNCNKYLCKHWYVCMYLAKFQPDCWHHIRKEVKKHGDHPDKQSNRKHHNHENTNRFNITYRTLQNQ